MKIPLIVAISVFSIPHAIKCNRWHYWERRYLFLDDKESHGIATAYRWAKGWIRQMEGRDDQ
ncbi:TPA: hypothetical protein I8372_004759 [Citrobacter farmeri]|nr:hypothetical protein [Citrobacter freundii]HAT2747115.1 hypothetical protein [Citrobacter farmeri]HAT2779581.1 hypothetical protein [Citrobacter farmeri]HAT2810544.1 hypothetical protein [Citrobacter farmeri]HBC0550358.1 hypothetical protein [Citrobacter farmeri]